MFYQCHAALPPKVYQRTSLLPWAARRDLPVQEGNLGCQRSNQLVGVRVSKLRWFSTNHFVESKVEKRNVADSKIPRALRRPSSSSRIWKKLSSACTIIYENYGRHTVDGRMPAEAMQPRHHSLVWSRASHIRLLRLTTLHCNLSLVLQGANFDTNVFDNGEHSTSQVQSYEAGRGFKFWNKTTSSNTQFSSCLKVDNFVISDKFINTLLLRSKL